MARKSLVATVVGIAAFAVPNAFADKGGFPHDGSNGQGRPAATQQTAATAPHGKALAKGHAKSHTTGRALAKGHAKSHGNSAAPNTAAPKTPGPPATNTHAQAGKTTICHATGSTTNPYVTITISNNAIPAHQRHQDGRDIIPAPEGGCPTGQQSESQQPTTPPTETQTSTPLTKNQTAAPQATQNASQPAGQVLGESVSGSSKSPSNSGNSTPSSGSVLGATTSGSSPSASTSPAATTTRAASSSSLPFTGTDAIIVAILGLAALLIGVTMRRAAAVRSSRS